MKIWGNGKIKVIFILFLLTIALSGYAHAAGLSISADIDGRSDLIIRGNTVQWHHYDNEAPGLSSYPPTEIPTTINGTDWTPVWPVTGSDRRVGCDCNSDVYTSLVPVLPPIAQTVILNIVSARDAAYIVQQPSAANNYTLIVEFNDNPSGGAALYEIELFYEGSAGTLY